MTNNRELLDEALARGVLSNEQALQLSTLQAELGSDRDERIKPAGSLNEIFVTFGIILLLNALTGLGGVLIGSPLFISLGHVALAWLIALKFHRGMRFRLPIFYCSISGAFAAATAVVLSMGGHGTDLFNEGGAFALREAGLFTGLAVLAAAAARFRLPFLMLPIGIVFTVMVTYAARYTDHELSYKLVLGACGLSMLAMAVCFDFKDPRRVTHWSDFAFWSYVIGSPLFVHSLFLSVLLHPKQAGEVWLSGGMWLFMLGLILVVTFAGILLNRRALVLSTLVYVGFVIFRLLAGLMFGAAGSMLLVTLLLIGIYVTALGSHWTRVRSAVMRRLPQQWVWLKRLPPYQS